MLNIEIIRIAGIALLILGGVSGFALFLRAISGADEEKTKAATGTLWGIFIVGMVGGITILAVTK